MREQELTRQAGNDTAPNGDQRSGNESRKATAGYANHEKDRNAEAYSRAPSKGLSPLPLEGMLVLDFSQFLSGPSASLRLADFGARVIKVERPGTGDICRTLYISDLEWDGDSSLFHAINRNKESFAADLKEAEDMRRVKQLIAQADVVIQNFRPGVMAKLGLDYQAVRKINPSIVYGEVTGYGTEGPWRDAPGQDLLVQSRSGLTWLTRGAVEADTTPPRPVPLGLAIADMAAGAHLAQSILAALVGKALSGRGSHVQVSLLESVIDLQSDIITGYLNRGDGDQALLQPEGKNRQPAPEKLSGIYKTSDGYIALGIGPAGKLGELIGWSCPAEGDHAGLSKARWKPSRRSLAERFATKPTAAWLSALEAGDYPCSEVLSWERLIAEQGFAALEMLQKVRRTPGQTAVTTRCPVRMDGKAFLSGKGSPRIGEDTVRIRKELLGE